MSISMNNVNVNLATVMVKCTPREDRFLELIRNAVNEIGRGEKKCQDRKILEHFKKYCKGGRSVADAVKIAIIKALDAGILEQATGSGVSQGGCRKMTYFVISDAIESMHVN